MTLPEPVGLEHPLMTLRHAAARTGLSATTLRRYIKAGRLRARLIPGRYGPEYVVDDEDLRIADLLENREPEPAAAAPVPAGAGVALVPADAADRTIATALLPAGDAVPGLLYRELLMKHEQLLVQFGMLRVTGQQLYDVREDARRREDEARQSAADLAVIRDRHAREIGELKQKMRQAELEIAAREDEIAQLRSELRRAQIASRNAATAVALEEQFARRIHASGFAPGAPPLLEPHTREH